MSATTYQLVQVETATGITNLVLGSEGPIRGSYEWVNLWAKRFNAYKSGFRCEARPVLT